MPNLKTQNQMDYEELTISELIDVILKKFHRSSEKRIKEISALFEEIVPALKEEVPFLEKMQKLFREMASEFSSHLRKEELVVFPLLLELEQGKKQEKDLAVPLAVMLQEHDSLGMLLKEIEVLSQNYAALPVENPKLILLYSKLKRFEKHLTEHIHLENNILSAKIKALPKG